MERGTSWFNNAFLLIVHNGRYSLHGRLKVVESGVMLLLSMLCCMQVQLECAGLLQTLFVISGSCQGLEIALDVDSVLFGAVVQSSSSTRQFIMNNTGDIGARSTSFSLFHYHPQSGVCSSFGRVCMSVCLSDDNFRKP